MTTLTYLLPTKSGAMPTWPRFRAWPDPEASICKSPSWLCPVNGKSFWSIQGPALHAYDEIKDSIRKCLVDREEDLYEGADESSVPHSIDCFMVGRTTTRARPFIVISCSQRTFSEEAMRVIKETTWWSEFVEQHLGFGGFILLSQAPRRIAKTSGRPHTSYVYTSDQFTSLYSMPIFFTAEPLGPNDSCQPQQATFGSIIYLEGLPFGLTVAHPLTEQTQEVSLGQSGNTVIYMDDSGDESSPESGSMSESSLDGTQPPEMVQNMDLVQTPPLPGFPSLVGQILCSSEGGPLDHVDWALMVLNADYFTNMQSPTVPENTTSQQKTLSGRIGLSAAMYRNVFSKEYYPNFDEMTKNVATPDGRAVPVLIPDGRNHLSNGILNASESFVCLPGSRQYMSLHSFVSDEDVCPGDCGKWAFDPEGNWYGHMVAGIPGTRIAYLALASRIFSDILRSTKIIPSISPNVQSRWHTGMMRDVKFWETSEADRLYVSSLYAASIAGKHKVVQILVDAGADVNAQGGTYGNALQAASDSGYEKVVQILVNAGANVNAQGGIHGNALRAASKGGHEKVVQILVDMGAEANAQGGSYRDPAQTTSKDYRQSRLGETEDIKAKMQKLQRDRLGLGERHPNSIQSMEELAATYYQHFRFAEAEEIYETVLRLRQGVLGEAHPDTIRSMVDLATIYHQRGHSDKAENIDIRVLEIRQEVLGNEHPDTIQSMANLAATYYQQSRLSQVEKIDVTVLELRRKVLDKKHPDTIESMANLATTYYQLGRSGDAEEIKVNVLELRREVLGEKHLDTIRSMASLATTYWSQKRWVEAENLDVQVLKLYSHTLGLNHPNTLLSMANLAHTWKWRGRDEDAINLIIKAYNVQKKVLGVDHPDTKASRRSLDIWLR